MSNTVSRVLSDETLNRIVQIESAGKLKAKAGTSSALGLFQFLNATWLGTVRKHRPDLFSGRTQAQVLALRTDPKVCLELGARFTEDNARFLGAGYTDGDLYLAHFLGTGTAKKFLRAPSDASAGQLAGAAAVAANRSILAGKTVGQVRAWAQRSMESRWEKAGRPDWIATYYGRGAGPLPKPDAPAIPLPPAVPPAPAPQATPAPPATEKVEGDPALWHVQARLKAMNYNTGIVDGKWGTFTPGMIASFITDRGVEIAAPTDIDMFHQVHDQLADELTAAEGEGFKRPVSEARANADEEKVEQIAPEIVPVKRNFLVTIWASISTFAAAIYNTVSGYVSEAWEFFTGHKDDLPSDPGLFSKAWEYVGQVPTSFWLFAGAAVIAFVAYNSAKGMQGITKSVQSGERP